MSTNPPARPAPNVTAVDLLNEQVRLTHHLDQRLAQVSRQLEEVTANQQEATRVIVVDLRMDFASMIGFMVKWALASIPAAILLAIIGFVLFFCGTLFLTTVGLSLGS